MKEKHFDDYRAIFNAANDGIFVLDIQSAEILDVNQKACDMFGYACEEVRHLGIEALSAGEKPYTREEVIYWVRKAAVEGPQLFEWISKDKSGRLFWIEVNLKRATIGGQDCLLSIVRDIDKRKKIQEELNRKAEFNKMITGISTRFINLQVDGIDEWATCALQRIGEFASVDRSYIFLIYDDGKKMDNTHEWCAPGIQPHIHRLKGLSVEAYSWLMERLKNGEVVYIPRATDLPPEAAVMRAELQVEEIQSLICVPIPLRGQLIGFAGFDSVRKEKAWDEDEIALLKVVGEIFANALDRKRTEEALLESETRYRLLCEHLEETVKQKVAELRQAQSLASIGQMVSVVAHEVRNPLQSIRLGMDILNMEMGENEDRSELLAGIDHGVTLLNSIITELLDYSRPVELQYSFQSVGALVEEALKTLSHKLNNISISMDFDQKDREISVDRNRFVGALVNVLSNAIEAMPGGGNLHISSHFRKEDLGDVVKISIKDSGCGISEQDLQRILEPFVTTKIVGTGLGLPICRKIIEAHRGSMQISSKPGEGTTVEITIPA